MTCAKVVAVEKESISYRQKRPARYRERARPVQPGGQVEPDRGAAQLLGQMSETAVEMFDDREGVRFAFRGREARKQERVADVRSAGARCPARWLQRVRRNATRRSDRYFRHPDSDAPPRAPPLCS